MNISPHKHGTNLALRAVGVEWFVQSHHSRSYQHLSVSYFARLLLFCNPARITDYVNQYSLVLALRVPEMQADGEPPVIKYHVKR